jgi:integrase
MKLPRYTHGYVDRHGKPRFYFRRAGFKGAKLPGLPWSREFMQALDEGITGQPAPIAAARTLPGSMRALAVGYYSSPDYLKLQPRVQRVRRGIIERFLSEVDTKGQCNGDKRAALLQRVHVVAAMAARASKPEAANDFRKALRGLMKHAQAINLRADDPTQGVKSLRSKNRRGIHTWTDAEIEQFRTAYAIGTKPRLAMELGLCTGQARQDVIKMGPQHISDGVLSWTRLKTEQSTGIEVFIPILPELADAIDGKPSGHLTFLATAFGQPFTAAGFGNWFHDQRSAAKMPKRCSFHGLRKAASRQLAEHGCTPHEIAAITGHATLKEIERYTRDAARRIMARSAFTKLKSEQPVANRKRS